MPRVLFVAREMRDYRMGLHANMRQRLLASGVDYRVVFGGTLPHHDTQDETSSWLRPMHVTYIGPQRFGLCWQPVLREASHSDLTIVGQENKLLVNYVLLAARPFSRRRIAFFGHGQNFQAMGSAAIASGVKKFSARQVDWWFAYTDHSASIVAKTGFPRDRITVVRNSIDTSAIKRDLAGIGAEDLDVLRREVVGNSRNVAVFLGSIYELKRMDFLLEAGERVVRTLPDFKLLVIGDDASDESLAQKAQQYPWLRLVGPKLGQEKARFLGLARVLTIPGLVGLAALDSLAYGIPLVTTNVPYHSPEMDYLTPGQDSVIVNDVNDVEAYTSAVIKVLTESSYRNSLQAAGRKKIESFSVEDMGARFSEGILQALNAGRAS